MSAVEHPATEGYRHGALALMDKHQRYGKPAYGISKEELEIEVARGLVTLPLPSEQVFPRPPRKAINPSAQAAFDEWLAMDGVGRLLNTVSSVARKHGATIQHVHNLVTRHRKRLREGKL